MNLVEISTPDRLAAVIASISARTSTHDAITALVAFARDR